MPPDWESICIPSPGLRALGSKLPLHQEENRRTLHSGLMPPMITVANANRSTVFEPNDLLLPAAYEAVGNALCAKKEVQGVQNSNCGRKLTCKTPRQRRPKTVVESRRCRKNSYWG